MSPGKTRGLLGLALLATIIAAWYAPLPDTQDVALSERTQSAAARAGSSPPVAANQPVHAGVSAAISPPVEVLSIHQRGQRGEDDAHDAPLFASARWTQPVKKTPVVRAAPIEITVAPLQAPPLPFRVLGRYDEAGQAVVFLQHHDQNLVVRVGDTIAEQYKVERLSGTTMDLRYLPLNQSQTLEVGSAQ